MVVTGAQLVEQRRLHFDPQRGALLLLDDDLELEAAPPDDELHQCLVSKEPVLNHVADDLSVHHADLVARVHTGVIGRRSGRDSNNGGQGHGHTG